MKCLLHFKILFLNYLLLLQLVSSTYTPKCKYFIDCGSTTDLTINDRTFLGDKSKSDQTFSVKSGKSIKKGTSSSSDKTSQLYQTARIFKYPSSYKFNITDNGTYLIRLHFFPFNSGTTNLFNSNFQVSTLNFTLLQNFTTSSTTTKYPLIEEFYLPINVSSFGIYFKPTGSNSFAYVNAIEVFLLPSLDLATTSPLIQNGTFYGSSSDALRAVYRVNIGGSSEISPDSYWRNWVLDNNTYLITSSGNKDSTSTSSLVGNSGPEVAPDTVYKSCRYVDDTTSASSITWSFEVSRNTSHLVRAHFCDIVGRSFSYYPFDFYMFGNYNWTVLPSDITAGLSTPFFYDYNVVSDASGYMNISIAISARANFPLAFLNGLEIMEFVARGNLDLKLFSDRGEESKFPVVIVISVACGVFGFIVVLGVVLLWKLKPVKKAAARKDELSDEKGNFPSLITEEIDSVSPLPNLNLKLRMTFGEVLAATQNFDPRLFIGEGGFGKVYKGTLRDGTIVAVKRSDSSHGQGFPEFRTEVLVLSKIRHRHLVSLVGYCDEGSEMILVYDFMEKGTLRDHLYNWKENSNSPERKSELTWQQRLEICIGSAEGLHYLHTSSNWGIIHRDVKSTNILLDEHLVAKVADFGLSQSGPLDQDHVTTTVKGSFGYLDPEYVRTYQLTDKSDVYSFGVVLLEVLCARLPVLKQAQSEEVNLAEWGLLWLKKGELEKIIDPSLVGQINPKSLRVFGETAEKCLRPEGADRPSMLDVRWDLEYALRLQRTAAPSQPLEDSTTDASSNMILTATQNLSIMTMDNNDDGPFNGGDDDSEMTASVVFSQLNVNGGR